MRPLALALLVLAAAPAASAQTQTVVKLATLAPAGSTWHDILKEMGQRWEQASGGQVKLRVYPGGVQGSEGEMIRKLEVGQLQAAALTNVGLHDVVPEAQALSVPMLFDDADEMQCAFARVQGALDAAFERKGLVVLQWSRVGVASFFCNAALATPPAVAGAKVFAWEGDPATADAWRQAGFHPVVLSSTDLIPALQTRMIDCVSNVPVYMLTSRAFERARYLVDVPLAFVEAATVVRKDVWEKIPAEVRPKLAAIAREVGARIDAEARRLDTEAVAAMQRQGLQVVKTERGPWRETLQRGWPALRGHAIPAEFFDAVKSARDACSAEGRR